MKYNEGFVSSKVRNTVIHLNTAFLGIVYNPAEHNPHKNLVFLLEEVINCTRNACFE